MIKSLARKLLVAAVVRAAFGWALPASAVAFATGAASQWSGGHQLPVGRSHRHASRPLAER